MFAIGDIVYSHKGAYTIIEKITPTGKFKIRYIGMNSIMLDILLNRE